MENKKTTNKKGVFKIILPDFIIIPYPLLEDDSISLIDERLYGIIYWFSKLKNEKCTASNETLARLIKTTPTTVGNSLKKLNDKGYIQRIYKDENKRNRKEIIPLVVFSRVTHTSVTSKNDPLTGGTDTLTDVTLVTLTDEQNKNKVNKNNKEDSNAIALHDEINSIIEMFSTFNPICKTYYGNTTQRKACELLIGEYGYAKVKSVCEFLPKISKMPYMPTITTPHQLAQKWSQLESALIKKKESSYKSIKVIG